MLHKTYMKVQQLPWIQTPPPAAPELPEEEEEAFGEELMLDDQLLPLVDQA